MGNPFWRVVCCLTGLKRPFRQMDSVTRARAASLRAFTAALLIAFPCGQRISHAANQVIERTRPSAAAQLPAIGRLAASKRLHLAIGLPLRNEAELAELLADLYNPGSPNYHQWRT